MFQHLFQSVWESLLVRPYLSAIHSKWAAPKKSGSKLGKDFPQHLGFNLVGCRLWGRTESDTTEAT